MQADHLAVAREVVQLAEERDRKLAEIDERLRVNEIEIRDGALLSADVDAAHAVIEYPAADVGDVLAKLRFMIDAEWWTDDVSQAAIVADLERLQTGAADRAAWDAARAKVEAVKEVEDRYDREVWSVQFKQSQASRRPLDRAVDAEMDRLQCARIDAEMPLMSIPSPDLEAFAYKFLVAFGNGRDANGWTDVLEAEAKRFLNIGEVAHG